MKKIVFKGHTTDGIPYIIRYPKRTDLHELWKFINKVSQERTFISLQGEEITPAQERKWLNTQLKDIRDNITVYLLTESEKKIIGVASINMSKTPIGTHVGGFGITVAKEYRHQGIGKTLMQKVLKEAKEVLPKLKIITLGVFANNPIAKKLYEEFGFKEYGRLPNGIFHKDKYVDDIKMYKEI